MDFAALPPEINSTRMYAGAGSGPMWTAASVWEGLGAELSSAAAAYRAVVSGLTRETWRGPASMSMQAAAIGYASWLSATGEQVKQAARQASAAAAAYEAAFGATVPPALVTENRAALTSLVATNIFGQNTPAIATTETIYSEMWAQDATAMYTYASGSAAASRLSAFTEPPQTTDPTGVSAQDAAVGQATSSSAANSPKALAQFTSTVPNVLQTLAGDAGGASTSDVLNVTASATYVASGVLFILGPLFTGPVNALLPPTILGAAAPALGAAGAAALMSDTTPIAPSVGRAGVLAGLARAGSVGGLSVPQAWGGVTGEMPRAAMAIPAPALVAFPEPEVDPLGAGGGGILPGSLMAAAAGGGGAAGGGYAATRGAGGAQRNGTGQPSGTTSPDESKRARYRPPASVIPQAAREADVGGRLPGQAGLRDQGGNGWTTETLRDEINDLRKQLTDLAMERDVLMRSLALWARGSLEE
jgi:PPE-repeat protein